MNVTRIAARNFRSYEELDLLLPEGVTALIGPNGAGKSSILAAIDVALFGARSLEPYLRRGADVLELTVEVEHGGEAYRIRRGLSSGGRSSLDFELSDPEGDPFPWAPLSLETQKATQQRIEERFGLTRATFRASAYLEQGGAAVMTGAQPAQRMAILRDTIGGLEVYDRAHEQAKARLRAVRDHLAETTGAANALEAIVATGPELFEEHEQAKAERDLVAERVIAATEAATKAADEVTRVQQRIAEEAAARHERDQAARRVFEAQSASARAAWDAYDAAVAQRRAAIRQRDELIQAAEREETAAVFLREGADADELAGPGERRCRECQQLMGLEALEASAATRREQARNHAARANDARARAGHVGLSLPPEPERPDDAPVWAPPPAEPVPDYGFLELRGGALRAQAKAEEERRIAEELGRRVAVLASQLANVSEHADRLEELLTEQVFAEHEVAVLEEVAAMFAPTGIPLLVLETAVPLIEGRAQEVLERLGGPTAACRLELRTQRENKDGALRDTLDILIHTASGETLPYEHWSGGEKMRLDLALRVGLAQLLLLHGAHVELFAVDEPDGLDAQGRAALAEVLEEMGDRYGFRKVFVISHDESLRDAIPQALEVHRSDGGTSVVAAA